jgi:hypothetical protein
MIKRILVAGTLGFVVLWLWTAVLNVFFLFTVRVAMNRVADEPAVHRVLKENITAPGLYLVNPALTSERRFPDGEPVFAVSYSGMGHEAAGPMMPIDIGLGLAVTLLAAGLLSAASASVLSSWVRRAGFVVLIGVLLAIAADVSRIGIGGAPPGAALARAAARVSGWTLAGLAMAWATRGAREVPRVTQAGG